VYALYKSIQRGNLQKIHDYVFYVPGAEIKNKYDYCKKELNKFLLKYEQDTSNEEGELEVAQNYYFLSKGSNKQTVKFKNKKVVSLFNEYVTKVEPDKEMKDFYIISHITKSNILYCFNYDNILSKCDGENVIVFIDIMQQIMNFYEKITIDQELFFKFFVSTKALVLMVISNNYSFGTLLREYIADISQYMEDDNDVKDYSKIRGNFSKDQISVCNKNKFHTFVN
jgi:hypothetical protein